VANVPHFGLSPCPAQGPELQSAHQPAPPVSVIISSRMSRQPSQFSTYGGMKNMKLGILSGCLFARDSLRILLLRFRHVSLFSLRFTGMGTGLQDFEHERHSQLKISHHPLDKVDGRLRFLSGFSELFRDLHLRLVFSHSGPNPGVELSDNVSAG
jgi:hypothetical protein